MDKYHRAVPRVGFKRVRLSKVDSSAHTSSQLRRTNAKNRRLDSENVATFKFVVVGASESLIIKPSVKPHHCGVASGKLNP